MRSLTVKDVCRALCEKKNTLILLHARPDGDAIGSAFALRALLVAMGMRAHCICADEIPHRLRPLIGDVQESLLADAMPVDFAVERVVSVDVASPAQLGALSDAWLERVDVMIDHHATGTPFADAWIVPDAAATGELIFALGCELVACGALDVLPQEACALMFAAIASDTGGFRYSNVTPNTHLCAAQLLLAGIDAAGINHILFESKPYDLMRAEQIGFCALRLYENGRVAVVPMTYEAKTQNALQDEHMETLVDIARAVEGVQVAVAVRQPTDAGRFRISMRSNGAFCVSDVCATFGGGGHAKAAGCTVEAENIDEAIERLLAVVREQMGKQGFDGL